MNATYRVVIKGVKDGFTEEQVTVKLAGLFKTSEEQAKKILVSGNYPVKKGIDRQTATKYQAAVEATGASVVIEPEAAIVTEAELPPKEIPALTKKCSRCGFELPDTAKFCRSCGVSQIESSSPVKNLEKVTLAKTIIETQQPAIANQPHTPVSHTEPKARFGADGRLPKSRASKKIWLAGGAVVITGMAIAAAILLSSKHPEPQPTPVVSNAPSQPPQAAPAETASNTTKTVAGDLSITNKKGSDDTETKTITLAGKIVYDQSDSDLSVEQAFSFTGRTVLLLSISGGGSACPANYRFLTVRPNGEVTFTGEFGTCSDTPKVSVNQEEITVALPDMKGRGEEAWKYANDALSQIKYADANAEAKAERITLDENQSATIKGVLAKETAIRTGDGKRVEINVLKLAAKSVIPGCDQHEALIDSIPIDDGISLTQVQGKSVFQVTIACSNAGASISAINLPGSLAPTKQSSAPTGPVGNAINQPQQQAALDNLLGRASKCGDIENCIKVMLEAVNPRKPEAIQLTITRIGELNKPQRGDRKAARDLNKKGLDEYKNNNFTSAIDLLKQAVAADPADVEVQSNLGFVALRANRNDVASSALSNALLIDSRRTSSWVPVAELFAVKGDSDAAVRALLLGYEFSANKEKTITFYEDKSSNAERETMKPIFVLALQNIKSGLMN